MSRNAQALPCPVCRSTYAARRYWSQLIAWRDRHGFWGRLAIGEDATSVAFRCACALALVIAMIREIAF